MRKLALSDDILLSVEKPSRYIGGEYNSYQKDPEKALLSVAFCFPDIYEIATANLGMQIIYEQFNRMPDTACDRVYSPWFDLDRIMRERKIPLFAVESQKPVKEFDLLLVTMGYEMCYTNVLQVLDLSGIPLHASARGESDPLVIGGGACAYNPEPMAEFFDVFYIGEAETEYEHIAELLKEKKAEGASRKEKLEALAEVPGLYIPQFYEVSYREDGTLASFGPVNPHAKPVIKKQAADLRKPLPYPEKPIVPFARGMMDRAALEVMRGCIRGCRFCQAGMICRPTRNRSLGEMKKLAVSMLEATGYEEINLTSLSSSDYSELKELLDFLEPYCNAHKINIGIPSMRIDSFSLELMSRIQDVRKTSLTFAPEAGSQRLRDIINKGLTEEMIFRGAAEAFRGGWDKVKLYFMLGQPFEEDADVDAIPALSNDIARIFFEEVPKEKRRGRVQVQASTSFFVPKPFTPFQWAPMCDEETFHKKAMRVKDGMKTQLNHKSLVYHYHDDRQTELEGVFARGDRRVAAAIEEAYRRGCIFDAWAEKLKYEVWMQVFDELGIRLEFYNYRERDVDELLPWDFIDIGVTKDYMKREWLKAKRGETTLNCREGCSGCGAACFEGGVCYESKN